MKKILLMIQVLSVFIWADLIHDEKGALLDLKAPYTIQNDAEEISITLDNELLPNETTQIPTHVDAELLPMEQIFDMPEHDIKKDIKKPKILERGSLPVKKSAKKPQNVQSKTKQDLQIEKIRRELNIQGPSAKELKLRRIKEALNIEEPSTRTIRVDGIREELKMGYRTPENESRLDRRVEDVKEGLDALSIDNALSSIKSTIGMGDKKKKDEGFSFTNSLSNFGDTIGIDVGIPTLFGGKSKKKESGILDSVMGIGFLGDIKDSGTSLYKGAKYSGQSAEMMSGMMYNSSKMYNTMFGVFDDSPFNIFEEEEEASIFDVFEHGNSVMDMFN